MQIFARIKRKMLIYKKRLNLKMQKNEAKRQAVKIIATFCKVRVEFPANPAICPR